MKMFMPEWAVNILRKAGVEYGEAIDSGLVTKRIAGAQKKVEERNFLARKNLLEYDEVMDVQRLEFYGTRQQVLEGRDVDRVIWEMIGEAIADAAERYVGDDYRSRVLAEWARGAFNIQVEGEELAGMRKFEDVDDLLKAKAKNQVSDTLRSELAEFIGEEHDDPESWDVKSIKSVGDEPLQREPDRAADPRVEGAGFGGRADRRGGRADRPSGHGGDQADAGRGFPAEASCAAGPTTSSSWGWRATSCTPTRSAASRCRRRRSWSGWSSRPARPTAGARSSTPSTTRSTSSPVAQPSIGDANAAAYLREWAALKYGLDLTLDDIQNAPLADLRERLLNEQEKFIGGDRLGAAVDAILAQGGDDNEKPLPGRSWHGSACRWRPTSSTPPASAQSKKGTRERDRDGDGDVDKRDVLLRKARYVLRKELTDLEQFVHINIFDQAWKDHLYAMDMLKGGIGLAGVRRAGPADRVQARGLPLLPADDGERARPRDGPDLPRARQRGRPAGPQQLRADRRRPRRGGRPTGGVRGRGRSGGGQVEGVERMRHVRGRRRPRRRKSAAAVASPGRDKAKGDGQEAQGKKDRNKKGKR